MIGLVKRIYTRPFLHETRSITDVLAYRIVSKVVWLAYAIKYRNRLCRTARFVDLQKQVNRATRRKAFVFANGPSVGDIDLNKIRALCESGDFDLIAINSYLSKSADIAKPTYAVFADNVHFSDTESQYRDDINKCKSLGIKYFAPAKYADDNDALVYSYCSLCDIDSKNTADITRPAGYYGVTAFFALSLAAMLDYSEIHICGYDNSYFLNYSVLDNGEMCIRHKHYYDSNETDARVACIYKKASEFFMDVYRHFFFLEKITANDSRYTNLAKITYFNCVKRNFEMDVYK